MTSDPPSGEHYDDVVDSSVAVFLLSAVALITALSLYHFGAEVDRFRTAQFSIQTLIVRTPIETGVSVAGISGGLGGSVVMTRFMAGHSILLDVPANTRWQEALQRLQIATPSIVVFYAVLAIPYVLTPNTATDGVIAVIQVGLAMAAGGVCGTKLHQRLWDQVPTSELHESTESL